MLPDTTIRPVTLADLALLQQIGRQTFYETFAMQNTEEDIRRYLEEGFGLERLRSELSHPDSAFFFALSGDAVVGYLKVNHGAAQTEPQDVQAFEIERIYVLRAHQGRRVGHLLFEHAMALARARQASYVWLGVWEENVGAIGFYERHGFKAFGQHVFQLGEDAQTDILMRRETGHA